jgi:hypothetical protein
LDKLRFPNTPTGTFGRWVGATWSRSPLGPGRQGRLAGAGEPPAAPVASSIILLATSSAAAAITVASSVALSSIALFTAASFIALLSAASLSATAASSSTVGPAPKSCHNRFCRGSSSLDDTSMSSRMTRVYLPVSGAEAMESPVVPPRPPAGAPLRLPAGPLPTGMPPRPAGGPPPRS